MLPSRPIPLSARQTYSLASFLFACQSVTRLLLAGRQRSRVYRGWLPPADPSDRSSYRSLLTSAIFTALQSPVIWCTRQQRRQLPPQSLQLLFMRQKIPIKVLPWAACKSPRTVRLMNDTASDCRGFSVTASLSVPSTAVLSKSSSQVRKRSWQMAATVTAIVYTPAMQSQCC